MTRSNDIAAILSGSRLFRTLSDEHRRVLAVASSLRQIDADENLFRAGDTASEVLLIVSADEGIGPVVQLQLGEIGGAGIGLVEGELIGDIDFLKGGLSPKSTKRIGSARVLRNAVLLGIPVDALAAVASADAELRRKLISQATERLIAATIGQAQRQSLNPQVRFATGMLALLDDYGHVVGNKGVFNRRLSQDDLSKHFDQALRWVSQHISDWSPRGLIDTVPITLPDVARVELIAGLTPPGLAAKFESALDVVEGRIAAAMLIKAGQTAADLLSLFPANPVAAYWLALASARSGATEQASAVLAQANLSWSGSMGDLKRRVRSGWRASFNLADDDEDLDDEAIALDAVLSRRLNQLSIDIGALHARLRKTQIETAENPVNARAAAAEAALVYKQVSDASPNHYCAVNAATLALIAGDTALAGEMAGHAHRLAQKDEGYWAQASMAEAELVRGDVGKASALFEKALALADSGKVASTRRQLQLLARLTGRDLSRPLNILNPGHALCFSGHIMRPSDGTPDELEAAEARLVESFRDWLHRHRIVSVHTSLAAGADILFAEQAIAAGIPVHVSLPFSAADFCKASVEIGNGGHTDWVKRYYTCLDQVANLAELWRYPVRPAEHEAHFASANRRLMGETLKQADLLSTQPMMLAAVTADARAKKSFAVTTLDDFSARGVLVETVDWPLERKLRTHSATTGFDPFRTVVFAFARSAKDNNVARPVFERSGLTARTLKDRRTAGHFVAGNVEEAIAIASNLAATAELPAGTIRTICDYGPVAGRSGKLILDELLKLEAASDLKPLTLGFSFATSAFAMEAIARGSDASTFAPMGVGEGDGELRGAREIYLLRAK